MLKMIKAIMCWMFLESGYLFYCLSAAKKTVSFMMNEEVFARVAVLSMRELLKSISCPKSQYNPISSCDRKWQLSDRTVGDEQAVKEFDIKSFGIKNRLDFIRLSQKAK